MTSPLTIPQTGGMRQRVSVITLGVRDLARARRFYEVLGWETGAAPDDDVAFFQVGDMVLALWDRSKLAEDSCVEDAPGWGGVTLALNLGSREQVDAVTEEARTAAEATKEAIIAGTLHPFDGPVKNQAGEVVIPEGEHASDEQLQTMDWYVEGVQA